MITTPFLILIYHSQVWTTDRIKNKIPLFRYHLKTNNMETKFCQSCGMPLQKKEDYGTNLDLTLNDDYCRYCYEKGTFTQDITMEEMINHCAQFVEEFNKDSDKKLTKEEAISQMKIYFPKLKRWAKN